MSDDAELARRLHMELNQRARPVRNKKPKRFADDNLFDSPEGLEDFGIPKWEPQPKKNVPKVQLTRSNTLGAEKPARKVSKYLDDSPEYSPPPDRAHSQPTTSHSQSSDDIIFIEEKPANRRTDLLDTTPSRKMGKQCPEIPPSNTNAIIETSEEATAEVVAPKALDDKSASTSRESSIENMDPKGPVLLKEEPELSLPSSTTETKPKPLATKPVKKSEPLPENSIVRAKLAPGKGMKPVFESSPVLDQMRTPMMKRRSLGLDRSCPGIAPSSSFSSPFAAAAGDVGGATPPPLKRRSLGLQRSTPTASTQQPSEKAAFISPIVLVETRRGKKAQTQLPNYNKADTADPMRMKELDKFQANPFLLRPFS
ncbi:unnamed protein product, partial [Mesorhabditis spiculigera]